MKSCRVHFRRIRIPLLFAGAVALGAPGGLRPAFAQSDSAEFIRMETSVNAIMVALVDHAAHEIWEVGSKSTLTGRDWQTVEQHATQLIASGTLISLGGTGRSDAGWANNPAWQAWARRLTDGGHAALAAVRNADQQALFAAGEAIVDTCLGCHQAFKPEAPTEGLMHVPHYED